MNQKIRKKLNLNILYNCNNNKKIIYGGKNGF